MTSRRRTILFSLIIIGLLVTLVLTLPITLTPSVRNRLIAALNERFGSKVEIASLRVSILPHVRVSGEEVVLRHKGRTDVPPLITIPSFYAEASLFGLLAGPLHLKRVHLEGMQISIPPGGLKMRDRGGTNGNAGKDEAKGEAQQSQPPEATPQQGKPQEGPPQDGKPRRKRPPLIVDEIVTERVELRILRRDPDKKPRLFAIHHLVMHDVGADTPWAFRATLRNPTPPGDIQTQGTFGPWAPDEPATTPLKGQYTFRDADLGVFKGIDGTLTSEGAFTGVLERIEVDGRTSTPDFAVTEGGNPVQLDTEFHAIVDGTNGNTWLKPVHARFLKTKVDAHGGVVETEGVKGRTVDLDVAMHEARVEDVLRLAIKAAKPPITGKLMLTTKFLLPPGEADALERLDLNGAFHIATARFSSGNIQAKIDELSRRSRGELDEEARHVASDLRGRFIMKRGAITFPSVTFSVPGARIAIAGTYVLRGERLDFKGTALLDAKLSEMTKGYKSVLLKVIDPLFRRGGNTVIPLTISGTVDDPNFGLDFKRALTRK
jgi:hypothetical protein